MRRDFRYALRVLRRSPGFSAVAIVTLALGIGANTTVFSIAQGLLLRPLPIADPAQVFTIDAVDRDAHSFPDYLDLQSRNTTLSGIAAYRIAPMGIETGGSAQRSWGYLATGTYFQMLGVQPAVGRFFAPDDDVRRGASPYAVLSHESWQRRFGGKADIVGTTMRINGLPYTVIGVAPRGFHGTEVFFRPEVWVPMAMQGQIEGRSWLDVRPTLNAWLIGRMRPGVTVAQATADLNIIARSIAAEHPRSHEGLRLALSSPGLVGTTGRTPMSAFMIGVMALAALVMLTACANLAGLLTARVFDRFREVAIRLSLGATRARIAGQLLVEALVLSVVGGAAGFAVATGILSVLSRWELPLPLPVQFEVMPDLTVFAFSSAVTVIISMAAVVAPARRAWKAEPARLTGNVSSTQLTRRWHVRDALLVAQVAFCCVLVTGSAVSLRSLGTALTMPLGFDFSGVSVAGFDLALAGYSRDEGRRLQQRALDAVADLPGVTAVATASSLPLTLDQSHTNVWPDDGGEVRGSRSILATEYSVSPGYFDVVRTRIVDGRDITIGDTRETSPVAVVNQAFVRKVMRTDRPVGGTFRVGATERIQVIGVVEDGKYEWLAEEARPVIFRPAAQDYTSTTLIVARTSMPEAEMAHRIGSAVAALDPRVPIFSQQSVLDAIEVSFLPARVAGVALSAFGVLAMALGLTGVYGLASHSVSARVREIGIRVAVGARSAHVLRFVLGRTAILLAVGAGAGITLTAIAHQAFAAVVFHASTRDPIVVIGVALTMSLVGLAAAWVPARRALAVDAAQTLRQS